MARTILPPSAAPGRALAAARRAAAARRTAAWPQRRRRQRLWRGGSPWMAPAPSSRCRRRWPTGFNAQSGRGGRRAKLWDRRRLQEILYRRGRHRRRLASDRRLGEPPVRGQAARVRRNAGRLRQPRRRGEQPEHVAQCLTVLELKRIWEPAAEGRVSQWNQVRTSFPSRRLALFGPGGSRVPSTTSRSPLSKRRQQPERLQQERRRRWIWSTAMVPT